MATPSRSTAGCSASTTGPRRPRRFRRPLSLDSPTCQLYVEEREGGWTLSLVDGPREIELSAEYVRALVPYVEARVRDLPLGGWLQLDDAWVRWRDFGGRAESRRDRIAQDRSRLGRALGRKGVASVGSLFETARHGDAWYTRVALPPSRLALD